VSRRARRGAHHRRVEAPRRARGVRPEPDSSPGGHRTMTVPGKHRAPRGSHASPDGSAAPRATELAIPIGPRVVEVLELAYRARRPILLEGPTGIGKSQIV